eukprot:COSAG05_NODE_28_length_29121_cov_56.951933_31_plen_166_part_00
MATPLSRYTWYGYPTFEIYVVWLPHFRDIRGMATPLSGYMWYGYPTFGIYVVWLPHFRDIRGMATPLSRSTWYGYPTFGIHVCRHYSCSIARRFASRIVYATIVLVSRRFTIIELRASEQNSSRFINPRLPHGGLVRVGHPKCDGLRLGEPEPLFLLLLLVSKVS